MRSNFSPLAVTMLLAASFVCCKTADDTPVANTANDRSVLSVRMSDAAGPYEKVMVNVQEVYMHSNTAGWTAIPVARPGLYNLPDLTNGKDTLLATGLFPSGQVSQVRLVLGPGNYIVKNGVTYALATPSAEESGLKININRQLLKDVAYTFWIDFDAEKSIVEKGNGAYSLKPVLRGYFNGETGTISGDVNPDTGADFVYAVNPHAPADTFRTWLNSNGTFMLSGMTGGLYDLTFTKAAIPVKSMQSVSVGNGANTNVGVVTIP